MLPVLPRSISLWSLPLSFWSPDLCISAPRAAGLFQSPLPPNPTAQWIPGQVNDAFPWDEAPSHYRSGTATKPSVWLYTRRICAMASTTIQSPHARRGRTVHVERLIGSILTCSASITSIVSARRICAAS